MLPLVHVTTNLHTAHCPSLAGKQLRDTLHYQKTNRGNTGIPTRYRRNSSESLIHDKLILNALFTKMFLFRKRKQNRHVRNSIDTLSL
jgi:hypothetical protein